MNNDINTPAGHTPAGPLDPGDDGHGDANLRWKLRGLRRELPPGRDLWPQIAARITAAQADGKAPRSHKGTQRWAPFALAASLLLAVGLAWQLRPLPAPVDTHFAQASVPAQSKLIHREAEAMTREYGAALHELRAATAQPGMSAPETAALRELDRSAAQIREALARDPDARFLLDRLRRTYAQRLALAQRATLS